MKNVVFRLFTDGLVETIAFSIGASGGDQRGVPFFLAFDQRVKKNEQRQSEERYRQMQARLAHNEKIAALGRMAAQVVAAAFT
jgi:hypothetical protein